MSEDQKMQAPAQTDARGVEFVPLGASDPIRLTAAMVRQFVANPTRSGALPNERDCVRFIMLCRARRLNPFEGDAYLIGFDGEKGAEFSLITAIQAFMKRAEASDDFDGMESGVIVAPTKGNEIDLTAIQEVQGDVVMDNQVLVGGWAKVYRKNQGRPTYKRVKLSTFNTGRSRWKLDPAGMIVKCAEADALRTAFPTMIGGLYTDMEIKALGDDAGGLKMAQTPAAAITGEATSASPSSAPEPTAPPARADAFKEKVRRAKKGTEQAPTAGEPEPTTEGYDASSKEPSNVRPTDAGQDVPRPSDGRKTDAEQTPAAEDSKKLAATMTFLEGASNIRGMFGRACRKVGIDPETWKEQPADKLEELVSALDEA